VALRDYTVFSKKVEGQRPWKVEKTDFSLAFEVLQLPNKILVREGEK
jgi:hypothetical protein